MAPPRGVRFPLLPHQKNKCNMYTTNFDIATDYADWMVYNLDLGFLFENLIQGIIDARADLADRIGCSPDDIELPGFSKRIYRVMRGNTEIFDREAAHKWTGRQLSDNELRDASREIWRRITDVISAKENEF